MYHKFFEKGTDLYVQFYRVQETHTTFNMQSGTFTKITWYCGRLPVFNMNSWREAEAECDD